MGIFRALYVVPLTLIPLIIYNIIMFSMGGGDVDGEAATAFDVFNETILWEMNLVSGAVWKFTLGNLMILMSLFFLFFEVIKATNTSSAGMADHALSTLVFIAFLIEFLMVKDAGSSTFFIMAIIALIDVMAGFMISISVARRDMTMAPGMHH